MGNITGRVQKHELKTDFEKFGRVHEVFIGNGFGFVTFDDSRSADRAVDVSFVLIYICADERILLGDARSALCRREASSGDLV